MAEEVCLGCGEGIDPKEEALLCLGGQVHFSIECLRKAAKAEQAPSLLCAGCNCPIYPQDGGYWCLPDGGFIHEMQYCLIKYLVERKEK